MGVLIVLGAPAQAQHSTTPVVLVNGYQLNCSNSGEAANFDNLRGVLQYDSPGLPVSYFNNCDYGNPTIDQLGRDFGQFLARLGPGPVDVVAHSMGGLIVRSYLAGLNLTTNTVAPPLNPGIRKLIFIGTPHFGTDWSLPVSAQVNQMQYGSALTWDLVTWNQRGDDLRGIDAIAIAGNGHADLAGAVADGVVTVASASLDFAYLNRTRVIPYCHINGICNGPGIVSIHDQDHFSYRIIRSFLDGNNTWQSIGISPAEATSYGGLLWNLTDANDHPILSPTSPTLTSGGERFSLSPGYVENAPADLNGALTFTIQSQSYAYHGTFIAPGRFHTFFYKFGPVINPFGVISSAGLAPGPHSIAADSLISIYGSNLASSTATGPYPWPLQLSDITVTIDGLPCPLNYAASVQVNALVPASLTPGLHSLTIRNSQGLDTVNLMIEPAVPTLFTEANSSAAALHANYQPVSTSNPANIGEYVSLYATGLGATTMRNSLNVANTTPTVWIDGQPAVVSFAGRAPGYQGLDQVNVQIPAGVRRGVSVPVVMVSGSRSSNQVMLAVN
jgi:uncharacterized protein (TIGR03437 family)